MAELCERSPNSFPATYRKIDGAEVISRNDRNLDCVITFQTHSILQRFMLRFEVLNMDCNDHLYIFDGAHQTGAHKQDISCRNTKENLGTLFTRTNYITLKYVTDSWGTDNSFKLVITAIKDGSEAKCITNLVYDFSFFFGFFFVSCRTFVQGLSMCYKGILHSPRLTLR